MCASLFLCPLKCVVRVTSPASISFAPASLTPLRGLRLGPARPPARLYAVRCQGESLWPRWPARIPGPALLRGSAGPPLSSTLPGQGSAPAVACWRPGGGGVTASARNVNLKLS